MLAKSTKQLAGKGVVKSTEKGTNIWSRTTTAAPKSEQTNRTAKFAGFLESGEFGCFCSAVEYLRLQKRFKCCRGPPTI